MMPGRPAPAPGRITVAVAQPRRTSRWELAFRVGIVTALVAGAGLAYWTLQIRLLPLQQRSRELTATATRLADQVDALQRKWGKEDVERIRTDYDLLRTQLFVNEAELKHWLDRLNETAGPQVLHLHFGYGKNLAQTTNDLKFAILTANVGIDVQPLPFDAESPYQRVLRFAEALAAEGKRADLAELHVSTGTNSIREALMVFNLWAGDETVGPSQTAMKPEGEPR